METAETILHTWMRRVWNEGDLNAIGDLITPETKVHGLGPTPLIGPAAFREFRANFGEAFTSVHIEIVDQIVSGDRVAGRFHARMTHTGQSKPVIIEGMVMITMRNGRAIEAWNSVDFLPMLTELSLTPADAMPRALGLI